MCWVLVVDDDEDIRNCCAEILADEGYVVSTATQGRDALEVLEHRPAAHPCLMLVDLLMPVMDGAELIEHVRGDPALADIPVVVISAAATVEPPAGTPMLRKPLGYDALVSTVTRHCGEPQRRAA